MTGTINETTTEIFAPPMLSHRLAAYDPGGTDAKGFLAKLMREEDWNEGYVRRCIEEYRRFIILAATGTELSVPSKAVDAVWHLHLTYTVSYWDDLCTGILGKPLHHLPDDGAEGSGDRFAKLYLETLRRYRETFGTEPPEDIWPRPQNASEVTMRIQRVSWLDEYREGITTGSFIATGIMGVLAGFTLGSGNISYVFFALFALMLGITIFLLLRTSTASSHTPSTKTAVSRNSAVQNSSSSGSNGGCAGTTFIMASCGSGDTGGSCGDSSSCGDSGGSSCGGGGGGCGGGGCGGGGD